MAPVPRQNERSPLGAREDGANKWDHFAQLFCAKTSGKIVTTNLFRKRHRIVI